MCQHLRALDKEHLLQAPTNPAVCEECMKIGGTWLHLRVCQSCGIVLCCDSSPNRHSTAHYHLTGHQVVISAEHGERWAWCYEDKEMRVY